MAIEDYYINKYHLVCKFPIGHFMFKMMQQPQDPLATNHKPPASIQAESKTKYSMETKVILAKYGILLVILDVISELHDLHLGNARKFLSLRKDNPTY